MSHYDINLDKNNANHVPLTPLTFLQRAKDVYPDYEAIVCLLYTSPSPRDVEESRMPSSA